MAKRNIEAGDPLLLEPYPTTEIEGPQYRRVHDANKFVAHSEVDNDMLLQLNAIKVHASTLGKIRARGDG